MTTNVSPAGSSTHLADEGGEILEDKNESNIPTEKSVDETGNLEPCYNPGAVQDENLQSIPSSPQSVELGISMEPPSAPTSPSGDMEELQFPTEASSSSQSSTAVIYTHPAFGFVTHQPEPGDSPRKVSCVEPGSGTMTVVAGGESELSVSGQAVVTAQVSKPLFKKVKVETEGNIKKGRWTCVDFKNKPEKAEKPVKEKKIAKSKKSLTKSSSNNSSEGGTSSGSRPPSAGGLKEDFARSQNSNYELENVTRDTEVTISRPEVMMSRSEVTISRPASPVVPILTDGFEKVSIGQVLKLADGQLAQVSLTILKSAPPEMATPLNVVVSSAPSQELNQVRVADSAHHQGIIRPQYHQQSGRMSQDGLGQTQQRSATPSPRIEQSQVSSLQQQQHSDEPSQQQQQQQQPSSQNQFSQSSSGSSRLHHFATSVSSSIIAASNLAAQSLVSTSQNQTFLQPISQSRPSSRMGESMVELSSASQNGHIDYEKEKPDRTSSPDNGQKPIDSKIEQALDLVKNHLTNSVRSELEDMKDKMRKLQDKASTLTAENEFMKSKLSQEVLSQLPLGQPLNHPRRAIAGPQRINGTSNGTEITNGTVNGSENINGNASGSENTNGNSSGSENINGNASGSENTNGNGSGRSSGTISPEN